MKSTRIRRRLGDIAEVRSHLVRHHDRYSGRAEREMSDLYDDDTLRWSEHQAERPRRAAAGEPLSEAPRMPLDGLKNGTDEVLGPWLPRDAAD
jgi:hypothetical protein